MKLIDYFKDLFLVVVLSVVMLILVVTFLYLFNVNSFLIFLVSVIIILYLVISFLFLFFRKRNFYNNFKEVLNSLDKKYMITEVITDSSFLDGRLLLDYLYSIDKSMHEEINRYGIANEDFRDYLQLWCHEIKSPIATIMMIISNNSNNVTDSILEEANRIDNYVEQVLFYARSENVSNDYLIKEVDLVSVINDVIKRNKKELIGKHIEIKILKLDRVLSDVKWISFIVNQIVINSIKYGSSSICIYSKKYKNRVSLFIEDNGIGIDESDIDRVFDKGFTGKNGRSKYNSTGMGLYLCKRLCERLGHSISVFSNNGVKIVIDFPIDEGISNVTKL